ncbi:hypothetical protein D9757_004919 [Collybiopsis confluens]|uniref:Uncharacterized protein n=1 Tax=Collybiopsis confluens TaxID=2823264 RepID=A0A8H5MCN9_9AGAR|nr:hypothetical protein D9757_004919 [Collybiopsis confluens]
MPGPSNDKKQRKSDGRSQKNKRTAKDCVPTSEGDASFDVRQYPVASTTSPAPLLNSLNPIEAKHIAVVTRDDSLLEEPYIHDSGNGPRVRNIQAFLASRFFSQPAALDDPLCAEFAQEEMLQMLGTVLPEELALIIWYNKSRASSRICPVCRRLYQRGDCVDPGQRRPPPEMEREQNISGICSSMCFIVASFSQCDPTTTKSTWGHTADEMDDASWAVLNGASAMRLAETEYEDRGKVLLMLIRMTRLDDLGLAQLCFPDVN